LARASWSRSGASASAGFAPTELRRPARTASARGRRRRGAKRYARRSCGG